MSPGALLSNSGSQAAATSESFQLSSMCLWARRLLKFQEPCKARESLPGRNLNIKRCKGGWKSQSSIVRSKTCLVCSAFVISAVETLVLRTHGASPFTQPVSSKEVCACYLNSSKLGKGEGSCSVWRQRFQ